jgi:hypothetical protein
MKKFIFLSSLLTLTRFADAQTTWLYTPDLAKEGNPLVSILGFGWTSSIIVQVIGLSFAIYALWVYSFRTVSVSAISKDIPLTQFISLFHFNDRNSFSKLFYKLPTNKNSLMYSMGYIFTYTLILFSSIVASSTTLLIVSEDYRNFYSVYRIPFYLYALAVLIVIFFSIRFYKKEMALRTLPGQASGKK